MKLRVFVLGLAITVVAAGALMRWDNGSVAAIETKNISEQKIDAQERIPEEAIRLRILANSDTDQDQHVKRMVRDQIVEQINGWLKHEAKPSSRKEARKLIAAHQDELREVAEQVLAQAGLSYRVRVKLGDVSFPAKWYGGQVYPAGMYEALLVTLGDGSGQNWWCVLFPPLCFVDGSHAQVQASDGAVERSASSKDEEKGKDRHVESSSDLRMLGANSHDMNSEADSGKRETEVRFFLWDALGALFSFISSAWTAIFG